MEESADLVREMKERFLASLLSADSRYNSVSMTKRKHEAIIEDVKRIKVSRRKESPRDYRLVERYDVVSVQGRDHLVEPLCGARGSVRRFVHSEELFDILYSTHVSLGHGGRDRMIKQLNARYKNITQAQIRLFLDGCETCRAKQKKSPVVKPIPPSHFVSRSRVDVLDLQPDGRFLFLLVYRDHATKFIVLKPLTAKRADEVANQLLDIFLLLGAPCILHSGDGRRFCHKVLERVKQLCPEMKIVSGREERMEQTNQDVEGAMAAWMAENRTDRWSEGARYVQFTMNRAYRPDIKRSPYEAMFGCPARAGLSSSVIPQCVLQSITTEEDLEQLLASQETAIMGELSGLTPEDIQSSPTESQERVYSTTPCTALTEDTAMRNTQERVYSTTPCTALTEDIQSSPTESPIETQEHVYSTMPSTPLTEDTAMRNTQERVYSTKPCTPLTEDIQSSPTESPIATQEHVYSTMPSTPLTEDTAMRNTQERVYSTKPCTSLIEDTAMRNVPSPCQESPLHEEVLAEIPSTSAEWPPQVVTVRDAVCVAHKCQSCDGLVHVIDLTEDDYGENVLCDICTKNQKIKRRLESRNMLMTVPGGDAEERILQLLYAKKM